MLSKTDKYKYEVRILAKEDYKDFAPVYDDFRTRAITEYCFELEPLCFDDFVEAIEKNLIQCLVLFEKSVPAGFLVYTTAISEAIELNIIHSYKLENKVERSLYLLEKFLEFTKSDRIDKIVCYPMLGTQIDLVGDIANYGFKFVGTAVLRFLMSGTNSREIMNMAELAPLPDNYKLEEWNDKYFDDAVEVVQEGFANSADALFDPRFTSIEGTKDIITKIVKNLYAEFLPEATTVLLYKNEPVGFCFMNITDGKIANIPIVSIKKTHQGKGLSKHILKKSIQKLIDWTDKGEKPITEVNTTTETNNFSALRMYRNLGFKEDYNYPQSYLPVN